MHPLLTTLRQNAPRITATRFLAAHPGSWVQYYDDTPGKDPTKALSARSFDPETARRKQRERCAVGFSLQPFLCGLLLDNAAAIAPYGLHAVAGVLDAIEVLGGSGGNTGTATPDAVSGEREARWREGLGGVPQGHRNATAASLVGKILGRL